MGYWDSGESFRLFDGMQMWVTVDKFNRIEAPADMVYEAGDVPGGPAQNGLCHPGSYIPGASDRASGNQAGRSLISKHNPAGTGTPNGGGLMRGTGHWKAMVGQGVAALRAGLPGPKPTWRNRPFEPTTTEDPAMPFHGSMSSTPTMLNYSGMGDYRF